MALPVRFRVAAAYLMNPARVRRLAEPEPPLTALRADEPDVPVPSREREKVVARSARELQAQREAGLDTIRSEDVVAARRTALRHGQVDGRGQAEFLWAELVLLAGIEPDLGGRQPSIPESSLIRWLELQDVIEPDVALLAYLAFHLTKRRPASFEWGRVVRIGGESRDDLLFTGVYDLHVHAGGLRNFTTTWRALRAGNLRLGQLGAFAGNENETMLPQALAAANRVLGPTTESTSHGSERKMLFEAIRDLRAQPLDTASVNDRARIDRWIDIERILIGRTLLWRKLRQPMFSGPPGLSNFQSGYFRQSKRSVGMSGKMRRIERGGAREIGAIRDLADICVDALRGIELRMGPLEWPADYSRFLDFWEVQAAESELPVHFSINAQQASRTDQSKTAVQQVGVRFTVHVQRSSPEEEIEVDLRARLDRQTACYALARHEDSRVADAFVRIDIAGPETHRSGSLYSPYFGFLLGQEKQLEDLEWLRRNRDRAPVAAEIDRIGGSGANEWLAIPPDQLKPTAAARRLRASWHAGEDFGDVLAGLYEIAIALASGLGPGDTIGHGLALHALPDGSDRRDPSGGLVSWRIALESYLWLYQVTENGSVDQLRKDLKTEIESLLSDVSLGKTETDFNNALDLVKQVRRLPICALLNGPPADNNCGRLLRLIQGGELDALPPIDRTARIEAFQNLIEDAQKNLVDEISRQKLLVELNPSSNWRIFAPKSLKDLPTVKLAEDKKLRGATIVCTDDPGTFGTSIEIEYALLRNGLEELPAGDDVHDILKACCETSSQLWRMLTAVSVGAGPGAQSDESD